MVESSECRMRLQEFRDIGGGVLNDIPPGIQAMEPKILKIHVVGKPADIKAFAEIDAATAVMGYSTAVVAEQVSSDDTDNLTAGGHLQSFKTIGIDGDDEIVCRQELLHTTAGTTVVATTNLYKEAFKIFGDAHGTGDADAAGNVDFRETDNTVLLRIPLGDNEGNGSAFLVPDNHVAMILGGKLTRFSLAADEGVLIRLIYIDDIDGESGQAAADRAINWIDYACAGATQQVHIIPKGHMFTSGTWISFWHSSFVDAGEDYDLEIDFLIWKK